VKDKFHLIGRSLVWKVARSTKDQKLRRSHQLSPQNFVRCQVFWMDANTASLASPLKVLQGIGEMSFYVLKQHFKWTFLGLNT